MKVTEDVLEFLDLKLTFDKDYKLRSADFIAKATHSFTYVLSSICFSKNSIENIPKAVVLRLRRSVILMTSLKKTVSSIGNISLLEMSEIF